VVRSSSVVESTGMTVSRNDRVNPEIFPPASHLTIQGRSRFATFFVLELFLILAPPFWGLESRK
jgi:hypothetical protein